MRFTIYALLSAAAAGLSAAYTQPVGDPSGNAITKPGLGEIVPAGTPYTITWTPTTPTTGTVTLLLLRGPSANIVPLYPIVENTLNTGTFIWTPSTALEPDTTRYGIQLIVDATGQNQYTSQFGISNPSYSGGATNSSSSSGTTTYTLRPASSGIPINSANSTSFVTTTSTSTSMNATTTTVVGTAPGYTNSTVVIVTPTDSMTVPTSLLTTTTSAPATTTPANSTSVSTKANAGVRVASGASALIFAVGGMFAMLL
ncbi:MAG: hypothetical protein M1829_006021 [Trizodia sp. TS-e1964]|nr:MAG: hypothetical protein M1829_006021 [Trizodia sp. TS-e1964]